MTSQNKLFYFVAFPNFALSPVFLTLPKLWWLFGSIFLASYTSWITYKLVEEFDKKGITKQKNV